MLKMNVGKNAMGVFYVNFEGDIAEIKKAVEGLKSVKETRKTKDGKEYTCSMWRYFAPRKEWSCIGFDNEESFKNFLGACISGDEKDIKSLKPKAKDMKADKLALSKVRKANAKAYVEKQDAEKTTYFETKYDKGLVWVVAHKCETENIKFYKLEDKDFENIALVLTSEELNEALDINEGKNSKFLEKLVLASASVEDVESVDNLEEKKEIKKEKATKKQVKKSAKVENKKTVENVDATIKALEQQVKELKKLYTKKQEKAFESGRLF